MSQILRFVSLVCCAIRCHAILCCGVLATCALGAEQVLLWPEGAPGFESATGEVIVRVTDGGDHVISNVHRPTITPYLPEGASPSTALVVAPGGGHRELWSDHEGHNLAKWLQSRGIAAFVLTYRLAASKDSPYTVDDHALVDLQRSIRLIRSRAASWKIHPDRVGAIGFSAGGELVALSGMRFDQGIADSQDIVDRQPCRPDFHALIYPGRSHRYEPHATTPPVFIACGYQDRPDISRGMAEVYLKFKEAGVPAELHIYANAGHGFGVRDRNQGAMAKWPERFEEWLLDVKMLSR